MGKGDNNRDTAEQKGTGSKQLNKSNYYKSLDALEIPEYWQKELRHNDLERNRKALRVFDAMEKDISSGLLVRKTHAKDKDLRKFAKSSFIRFDRHEAFKFLDEDFDREFNTLDEIRIHAALLAKAKERPLPPLIQWVLDAKRIGYKRFLIKEIGFFNQKECSPYLLEMYQDTKEHRIKEQIAWALSRLQYAEAVEVLAEDYDFSPEAVQNSIIDAMGAFDTPEALAFLKESYPKSFRDSTKIKIIHNISLMHTPGSNDVLQLLKDQATSDFEKSIFEQAEYQRASF